MRSQLRDLESKYPRRIAEARAMLAELNEQIKQVARDRTISERVVALAQDDLNEMKDLLTRAEQARDDYDGYGRHVVVSALGSFHGRTLATLHATGQTAKHEAFQPLPEGFRHVAWNDVDALVNAIDPTVAAVLLEPVQGEGGVHPADRAYFAAVREVCTERNVLFMVDEIQTGLGRTGAWFAHQHLGVTPDVVTVAKAPFDAA